MFGIIATVRHFVSFHFGKEESFHKLLDFAATYRQCGTKSDWNNTILINPKYPQPYSGGTLCSYRIYRESYKVCQLRIDFLSFSLAPPNGDGLCLNDYFTVTGGSTTVPRICGENTGQHVYVDVSGLLPVVITVATSSNLAVSRRWQFRVTQIRCGSPNRGLIKALLQKTSTYYRELSAPTGCLQYYLESSGAIRSFNYAMEEPAALNTIGTRGSRQIAGLNYNICIKPQAGMCSVTFRRVRQFSVT
jgi:CUB domain